MILPTARKMLHVDSKKERSRRELRRSCLIQLTTIRLCSNKIRGDGYRSTHSRGQLDDGRIHNEYRGVSAVLVDRCVLFFFFLNLLPLQLQIKQEKNCVLSVENFITKVYISLGKINLKGIRKVLYNSLDRNQQFILLRSIQQGQNFSFGRKMFDAPQGRLRSQKDEDIVRLQCHDA